MSQTFAALIILATSLLAPPAPPGLILRYRPEVGRTAVYRVSVEMSGTQTLQDEPRAVNVRAELEVTEEVVSVEPEGSFWLRVTGRAVRMNDPTGTFGAGQHGEWPAVEVRMSSLGVVLETRPDPEAGHLGPLPRAFAAAMLHPAPVVLPAQAVKVGDQWQWEQACPAGDGARQSNRLVSVSQADRPVAGVRGGARPQESGKDFGAAEGQVRCLLASSGREPVRLEEASPALGLTTRVSGEMSQRSEVDLLLPSCLVALHRGEMRLETQGESTLELPEGPKAFALRSDLRMRFHIRLVALSGKTVPARPGGG